MHSGFSSSQRCATSPKPADRDFRKRSNLGEVQRGDSDIWAGEKWLDVRGFSRTATGKIATIRSVMGARLALARSKGCAAVEPDNVDAWSNDVSQNAPAGTPRNAVSASDQLAYNRWTADAAHAQGLSVLLKNDLDQVADLQDVYDGALNEECFDFTGDCFLLKRLRDAGKAIYVVEYHNAGFATAARKAQASQLHLNVILTDPDATQLDPYARFGTW
ncbi:endo alpha-1,4 polygalactosaminidase [Deinococcus hopiensis]|uniref:endo alpha-1,4 polygalactosaminidase n=1 Tax=Deinococcus hopiensis TaxID=309885 RepID=UPI0014827BE0|nr:endo alpha-1,4 polygalactosaminidase [Deinococcus hopiensis]